MPIKPLSISFLGEYYSKASFIIIENTALPYFLRACSCTLFAMPKQLPLSHKASYSHSAAHVNDSPGTKHLLPCLLEHY